MVKWIFAKSPAGEMGECLKNSVTAPLLARIAGAVIPKAPRAHENRFWRDSAIFGVAA